jgi:hypothetical protein
MRLTDPRVLTTLVLGMLFTGVFAFAVYTASLDDNVFQAPTIKADAFYLAGSDISGRLAGTWGATSITSNGDITGGNIRASTEIYRNGVTLGNYILSVAPGGAVNGTAIDVTSIETNAFTLGGTTLADYIIATVPSTGVGNWSPIIYIFKNATSSYAFNAASGALIHSGTCSDVLEQAVASLPTTGGIIYLDDTFDGDGQTATINRGRLTIITGQNQANDIWVNPRIDRLIVNASAADLKSLTIDGLSMRELYVDANDNVVYDLTVKNCQFNINSSTDPTLHGIELDGTGVTGYWYLLRFIDCSIMDRYDQTTGGRDLGAVSVLNANDGSGQVWFTRLEYRNFVDDCCLFAVDTNGIASPSVWFQDSSLVSFGDTTLFYAKDGSNTFDLKVINNWIETHDPTLIYKVVGNGAGGNQNFGSTFSGNTVSVGGAAGEVVTFITNTMTTGDTVAYRYNGVFGDGNIFSATGADATFVEGTIGKTNEFDFNVHYNYYYGSTWYKTDSSGSASITSGSTSVVVNHLCPYTPSLSDIMVLGAENPTNDVGSIWVSSVSSTQFTVNVENNPGASNFDVVYFIVRH